MTPLAHVGENRVDVASARGTGRLGNKPAQKNAVDTVLPHPFEVEQGRSLPEPAIEPGGRAVGHLEIGNFPQITRVVFGSVGPHVDREPPNARLIEPVPPVPETEIRAVAGRVEPSLVTAKNLALERRGINVCARGTSVGALPRLVRVPARSLRGELASRDQHEDGQQKSDRLPTRLSHRESTRGFTSVRIHS